MLPKLCHLDNDLEIIIIIQYIYCVVHMTYIPYLGTFFFSRYPSVALARNINQTGDEPQTQDTQANMRTPLLRGEIPH